MSEVRNYQISTIADRYAVAMLELAEGHDILDAVDADLYLVKDVIKSSSELRDLIDHPLIKVQDKKEILEEIFKEHISVYSMNLAKLLADKNRLFILQYIWDYYNKLLCKKRNISTAKIITAISLDEGTLNRVKEKLEKLLSKYIKVEPVIDKEIIAGMIVQIDDKVLDGSIRTKIDNMKKQLIKG